MHILSHIQFFFPGFGVFTLVLSAVLLLWLARLVLKLTERYRSRIQLPSLTSPGPQFGELILGDQPRVFEPKRILAFRNEPKLAALGPAVILLLVGSIMPGAVDYWYHSRTFEPLNFPISCARGHVTTPDFYINVHRFVEVSVQFDPLSPIDPPGCLAGSLKTRWASYRHNRRIREVVSDTGQHWLGSFGVQENGSYRIEIDILSDTACLDTYHPRLVVWTSTLPDDRWHEDAYPIAAALVFTGGALLLFSVVSTLSHNASCDTEIATYESITSEHPRPPRRSLPRFVLNPHTFGFIATIVFTLVTFFKFVESPDRSRGFVLNLLKSDRATPASKFPGADDWATPIIVRIADKGRHQEPQLYVNSLSVDRAGLEAAIKRELARRPQWVVYVEADSDIDWAYAADVIDTAHGLRARVYLLTPQTQSLVK